MIKDMSKDKTELEKSIDRVESLVMQTNAKIKELGVYANELNIVLSIIQKQFDKIRNVPSDTKRKYEISKKVRLDWKQQVEKIENDYKSAAQVNVGTGAAGTVAGVGLAALGPTAAMSIATTFGVASTGTAISSLSGAAATNAALAWLGGGALAAGGSGIAGGTALLSLAGPIGWSIAAIAIVSSGIMYWRAKSDKTRLENIFLNIAKRDQKKYELAIVEFEERFLRIKEEKDKLISAIVEIGSFGLDYQSMNEQQQYALGTYVNLMFASTQLLVNPIIGLQPNFSEHDFDELMTEIGHEELIRDKKDIIIYLANLLYKVETDCKDRELFAKSLKKNEDFLNEMNLDKKDIDLNLINLVNEALSFLYKAD
jgi:hypothetical protein